MSCLEESPAKRPQTARDLGWLISKCDAVSGWTIEDGDRWWADTNEFRQPAVALGLPSVVMMGFAEKCPDYSVLIIAGRCISRTGC